MSVQYSRLMHFDKSSRAISALHVDAPGFYPRNPNIAECAAFDFRDFPFCSIEGTDIFIVVKQVQDLATEIMQKYPATKVEVATRNRSFGVMASDPCSYYAESLGVSPEDVKVGATAIKIKNLEHFSDILKMLADKKWLTQQELQEMRPVTTELSLHKKLGPHVANKITPAQVALIKQRVEANIKKIIEACKQTDGAKDILGPTVQWATLDPKLAAFKRDLAFAVLVQASQKYHGRTLFHEQFNGLQACEESAVILHQIYYGNAHIEEALLAANAQTSEATQTGTIPSLHLQREVLIQCFEECLTHEFGPERQEHLPDLIVKDCLPTLRQKLFADGYSLDLVHFSEKMFSFKPYEAVVDALKGKHGFSEGGEYASRRWGYQAKNQAEAEERLLKIVAQDARFEPILKILKAQDPLANPVDEISPQQAAFIRERFSEDIKALIEACKQIKEEKEILGSDSWAAMDPAFMASKRDIAFALLIQSLQGRHGTLFYELFKGLRTSCAEPAKRLLGFYEGKAGSERELRLLGKDLPALQLQRETLMQFIEETLTQEFGPEKREYLPEIQEKSLLPGLRMKLFAEGYQLDLIEMPFNQEAPRFIKFQPYFSVVEALNGKFAHRWPGISPDEGKRRIDEMKRTAK